MPSRLLRPWISVTGYLLVACSSEQTLVQDSTGEEFLLSCEDRGCPGVETVEDPVCGEEAATITGRFLKVCSARGNTVDMGDCRAVVCETDADCATERYSCKGGTCIDVGSELSRNDVWAACMRSKIRGLLH